MFKSSILLIGLYLESMLPEEIYNKKIFMSALDWGLGHCARMIPLIRKLLNQRNEIIFGVTKTQESFFKNEKLDITLINFPGYNINIPTKNWEWNFLKQLPKLSKALQQEHELLDKIIQDKHINLVISDHRYGLNHSSIESIFITHQMTLPASKGSQSINKIHQKHMAKFSHIWTVDYSNNTLAGKLSQPIVGFKNHYIGSLSRCYKTDSTIKHKAICIVSGPEPHKSKFYDLVKKISTQLEFSIVILAANPDMETYSKDGNLDIFSHVNSTKLNDLINESEWVISRSGFTTIMDIIQLDKKAILIPTPGQGEQEYLAKFHSEKSNKIHLLQQKELDLIKIKSILYQE